MSDHVSQVLSACSSSIFALRLLRNHGLRSDQLNLVARATTIASILYATPAWWGFQRIAYRIAALVRRCSLHCRFCTYTRTLYCPVAGAIGVIDTPAQLKKFFCLSLVLESIESQRLDDVFIDMILKLLLIMKSAISSPLDRATLSRWWAPQPELDSLYRASLPSEECILWPFQWCRRAGTVRNAVPVLVI